MGENLFHRLGTWRPGCWCAATLELGSACAGAPVQWMYVVWRPMQRPLPFLRPDGWGVVADRASQAVAECIEPGAAVYVLGDDECLWSAWLDMALACVRMEPWLEALVQQRCQQERQAERARYLAWYGSRESSFDRFMDQVVGSVPAVEPVDDLELDPPPPSPPQRPATVAEVGLQARPDVQAQARLLADGALEFELRDAELHGPLWGDVYRVEPACAELMRAELQQRLGRPVDDLRALLLLLPEAFPSWDQLWPWLQGGGWLGGQEADSAPC